MTPLRLGALVDAAKTGEAAKSGPIGFLIILVLCIACYFLFKSMSKHLKRVREDFPSDETTARAQAAQAAPATSLEPVPPGGTAQPAAGAAPPPFSPEAPASPDDGGGFAAPGGDRA